jgi:hypothetical protein
MLSSGANVIIGDKMLSCGANVVMLSFGTNFTIWCYHVMLSSGMITPPYFIFPENFTHSESWNRNLMRFSEHLDLVSVFKVVAETLYLFFT